MYELDNLSNKYDFIKLDNKIKDIVNSFKSYKDTKINFNDSDDLLLRDYQKLGVKWLLTLSKCNFGGILADEMGLGKSLQTIKYIEYKLKENKTAKFLIVVPTSLIYNWLNEFKKYKSKAKVVILAGQKIEREEILSHFDDYDVFITTYGILRQDIDSYLKFNFDTCIIDEAQNIKNPTSISSKAVKSINANVHFALTGTPIENSLVELYSIFDFIMPGFFGNLNDFKNKYSIKTNDEDNDSLIKLNEKISPFILRRKKKDVLKELPDKIENNIYVDLSDEQKELYVEYLNRTKEEINTAIKSEGFMKNQILILSLLTKLREICLDPRLLIENYKGESAKIEILLDIVKQTIVNGHKMLIFSQFPSFLKIVKNSLSKEHIDSYYLDGSTKTKDRLKLVDEFNNNDDIKVFLISLKAGGTGLNLTSADTVIHLDPWWNPAVQNQATDRSHRIGQKHVVEVIKIIARGTIEEKIVELQEKKKNLSDNVIEGENRDKLILSKLSEKELKDLLKD